LTKVKHYDKIKKKGEKKMFGYTFKVIKINKDTKEVETILENEEFVMIAKDVANKANNTKKENEEIKLFNFKDEEIEYKTNNRTNERNYRTNTKIMRNNYIKMY
jgi:3-methyladenine DNA glycosylase AlkC